MEIDTMIFFRSFLFRTFLVGLLFAILLGIGTIALRNTFMPLVTDILRVSDAEINEAILTFFTNVRLVLVFLILAPAVAMHWMIVRKK